MREVDPTSRTSIRVGTGSWLVLGVLVGETVGGVECDDDGTFVCEVTEESEFEFTSLWSVSR